jgi:hypothetical protein
MRRACLALALLSVGCLFCSEPWNAYPEKTKPDLSCSTGNVHGHDVYIWKCLRGQHVVVAQYSAEMTCRGAVKELAACGTLTPLEAKLALTPAQCAGPRAGRAWR